MSTYTTIRRRQHRHRAVATVVTTVTVVTVAAAITACASRNASSTEPQSVPTSGRQERTTVAPATDTPGTSTTSATSATTKVRPQLRSAANGLTVTRAGTGAWVVAIDPKALRFNLMPGSVEPKGSFIRPSSLTAAFRPKVIAAFNGGFKFKDSHGGFYLGGIAAVPLVDGAASLVIFKDGTATVGQWNRDFRMGPNVEAVLQNLRLLVVVTMDVVSAGPPVR